MIAPCIAVVLAWQDPAAIGAEIAHARAAVQAAPASADAQFVLGRTLAVHLDSPAAIAPLREALRLGLPPLGMAEARHWLARVLHADGQEPAALHELHTLAAMADAPAELRDGARQAAEAVQASHARLRAVTAAEHRAVGLLVAMAVAGLAAFGAGVAVARRAAQGGA